MVGGNSVENRLLYIPTSPISIEAFAKKLIGKTFLDVVNTSTASKEAIASYSNYQRKGGLGNLLEELYFGYDANSESSADFKEAGVELKASPYEKRKDGTLRAGERLVLTMISYKDPVEPDFYTSHLWEKSKLLLLIYYWRNKELESNLLYRINYVKLFTPSKTDLIIIEQDYKVIIGKIEDGKAHELSESDTLYLGACTKGATAEKSTVPQYYPPHLLARRRAFCYKQSYMSYVLNQYLVADINTYEPIIKDGDLLGYSFGEYITGKINQYAGLTDYDLCVRFGRDYNNNKAQWSDLSYRMLGIKSNKAQEFVKANIVVKAIRLEESGKMRESSPLPTISFKELIQEEWENSSLYNYFEETKFLFIVFRKYNDRYVLMGSQLWNMPYYDLNEVVYSGWKKVKDIATKGIELRKTHTKAGVVIKNNLPSKSENAIIHIRPHTSKTFYKLKSGEIIGDGNYSNGDELPDGQWMTKQSFWLNNSYVVSQLNKELTRNI